MYLPASISFHFVKSRSVIEHIDTNLPVHLVGLTGGIGAGKSVVARVLRTKGFEVFDCDHEARFIMEGSLELKDAMRARFSDDCLFDDGSLNRKRIAEHIFGDDCKRIWLNSKVHGLVRQAVQERLLEKEELLKKKHSRNIKVSYSDSIVFVESAILFSSGLAQICSLEWLVEAPDDLRIKRAAVRDSADESGIRARMEAQKCEFRDLDTSKTLVLENSGNMSLLHEIDKSLETTIRILYH